MSIRDEKFAFYLKTGGTVLLVGLTGTGKTTMLRHALEANGFKIGEDVAYYSTHDHDFHGNTELMNQ